MNMRSAVDPAPILSKHKNHNYATDNNAHAVDVQILQLIPV